MNQKQIETAIFNQQNGAFYSELAITLRNNANYSCPHSVREVIRAQEYAAKHARWARQACHDTLLQVSALNASESVNY